MTHLKDDLIKGAKAAARFTGLSERAIYHLIDTERVPHSKVGRDLYFRKSELQEFFSSKRAA